MDCSCIHSGCSAERLLVSEMMFCSVLVFDFDEMFVESLLSCNGNSAIVVTNEWRGGSSIVKD